MPLLLSAPRLNTVRKNHSCCDSGRGREWKRKGYLAGAERDAIQVEGFDFGNSPFSYMGDVVKGKTIAITTTNGTQAIEAAKDAYKVVIGSF